MNKCDISIDFYRPDREFRSGQSVQGWVRLSVNKSLKCRALHLNVYWKTHGRGNTTRQNYFQQTLFKGEWQVGETYEYPFEFTPPDFPLTYHGHYLNIDHFVSVRADIPWAIDARHEEEFMWRVGDQAPALSESESVVVPKRGCGEKIGLVAAFLLAAVPIAFVVSGASPWFLLLLIPAMLTAFFSLRSRLAESKLGEVKWNSASSCYAGEELSSTLQIGPVGNATVTEITSTLFGQESVTSGSGTDATTYTHQLHKQKSVLVKSPDFGQGEILELEPKIIFPDTSAFSVDLPDNKIQWTATIAIRLKMWPDWVQTREIQLKIPPKPATDDNTNPAFDTQSLHELIAVANSLTKCGRDTGAIDGIISEHADKLFTVSVDTHNVTAAAESFDDPEYAQGRTLVGTLTGSEIVVSLQLPSRYNSTVDSLIRGTTWDGKGAVIRWNALEQRLIILGI